MSVFIPAGVESLGFDTWRFIVAAASPAALTVAELTATTGCDIQLAMRPGFGLTGETPKQTDRRLGSRIVYESFGPTTQTFADAILIDMPQTAPAQAARKHLDVLTDGATGWLVNRRGIGSSSENWVAWATTQRYMIIPCAVGAQTPQAGSEDGGKFEVHISFAKTGPITYGVVA